MKIQDVGEFAQKSGCCVLIGEYRGFLAEKIRFVDKKDGKAKSFVSVVHLVELGADGRIQQVRLSERVPPEITEPEQVKCRYRKGKTYVFPLIGLELEQGRLGGRLANLEAQEVEK